MTIKTTTRTLLVGASLVATAFAAPAFAQDEQTSAIDALNADIVVTATKKKDVENVQSVPLAITAFSQGSLEAMKVRDIQSLTYSAPNVSLDQLGTSRGTANFSIRGLGVNSSIPSIDPTVGVFVDGVYIGVNNGLVFDVFDLGSVEIARGPQGILFGRNTTGGAVLINTGDPTPDLRVKAKLSYDGPVDSGRGAANFSAQAVVSGPLVQDVLNFKVGAYINRDGGYFKNLFDNSNHGKAQTQILRGALEYKPTETLRMVAKLDYFKSDGDGAAAQNHGIYKRDTFDFAVDNRGYYHNRTWFGTHKTELELGEGKLTNIFGWRNYDATTDGDIDATKNFIFHSNTWFQQEQFSDELRYNQTFGALDVTTGAFWFTQKLRYDEARRFPSFISPWTYGGGAQDHDVLGLFLSGDYALTDALTATAGIRWSKETKDVAVTYIRPRAACSVVAGTCPTAGKNPSIPTENNGFTDKKTWESWSPKLGLQYAFSNRSQVYANWTRGFRSGGYNFRVTNANAFEAVAATRGLSFDEEQVDSYEVGLKFQSDDRKLTLNLAAFRTDVGNMQREINQASASGVSQSIYNTADAKIEGFEAEGRFAVTPNLLLTANVGYVNARYTQVKFDLTGDGVVNALDMGLDLPRTPEWTYGFGVVAELPVGDKGAITARASFQHRDRYAYTDSNFGWITASDNLEANLSYKLGNGVTLSVFGKNLLDQVQHGGDTQLGTATQAAIFGGPLSTGVDAVYGANPKTGTFSPLAKGRVLGFEAAFEF